MAERLSRERIVVAALDVLDEGGADAVTVRAVAKRLGVQAPALYWHVRSKQELLDEMGTEIQRRVQRAFLAQTHHTWPDALAGYAHALRGEYLRHRDGARTFSGTRLTDPELLRAQEPWLQRWTRTGLAVADLVTATELVTAFVVGFVIEEQERSQSAQADPDRYDIAARDTAVGESAPLARAVGHLRTSSDNAFDSQLGIVMTGISAVLGGGADHGATGEPATAGRAIDRRGRRSAADLLSVRSSSTGSGSGGAP